MFGQITHLCGRMAEDPESSIIPLGAHALGRRLINFRQWSERSEGYHTTQALLDSCALDADGLVDSLAKATELTAEAWVQTARIYLQCRFFHLPRSHPSVQGPLKILLICIERMPRSGRLFTSQSPFFPVFIMGLISQQPEQRRVVRNWFEEVLSRAPARSSVPPVWRVLQDTWDWMDDNLLDDPNVDETAIGERNAWWERVVDRLVEREGRLSLV